MNNKMNKANAAAAAANQMSKIENMASLDIDSALVIPRLTGIICTIGPASDTEEKLLELMAGGMSIARLNFSHGTHEYHKEVINKIRNAVQRLSRNCSVSEAPIGIAVDIKGPEVRTGILASGEETGVLLEAGNAIQVTFDLQYNAAGTAELLFIDNEQVFKLLRPGNRIYVDNGLISLLVRSKTTNSLVCEIENTATLGSTKKIHLPGVDNLVLPVITEQDILDLQFAIENNVDFIFASHVRNAEGVKQIRQVLGEKGKDIKIVAKIEKHEAIQNIDEIIDVSDGVMIARGELGIEIMAMEKIFLAQKMIIARCNKAGKPVLCSSQMLESMVKNPRPNRPECSDVANAVLDGVDCIVLTTETARGNYPIDAVSAAHQICREAEAAFFNRRIFNDLVNLTPSPTSPMYTIAIAAVTASLKSLAAAIVVITSSGNSAFTIAKYRPRCPILLVCRHKRVTRQAHLYRGILPVYYDQTPLDDWQKDVDQRVKRSFEIGKQRGFLKPKDEVILIQGWRKGKGATNCIRIVVVI